MQIPCWKKKEKKKAMIILKISNLKKPAQASSSVDKNLGYIWYTKVYNMNCKICYNGVTKLIHKFGCKL